MNYRVYAIVVVFNGSNYLDKLIKSLRDSSTKIKVIFVDNNSSDRSISIIEDNLNENIILIKEQSNHGFSKGNNIGIQKALEEKADFIFLINQDAYIDENTVQELINSFELNGPNNLYSPVHYDYTGEKLDSSFNILTEIYKADLDKIDVEYGFIPAAAWFIPTAIIEEVGLLNDYFFLYGEDNEYVNRLKYFKRKLIVRTSSNIYHHHSADLDFVNNSIRSFEAALKYIYLDINKPIIICSILSLLLLIKHILFGVFRYKSNISSKIHSYFKITFSLNQLLQIRRLTRKRGAFL